MYFLLLWTTIVTAAVQQPVISTEPRVVRAPVSDSVTLQCAVRGLGQFVPVWRRGEEVLSAGALMVVPDPRFSLVGGGLRIERLERGDGGEYTCSIATFTSPVSLTHSLEILGRWPPRTAQTS